MSRRRLDEIVQRRANTGAVKSICSSANCFRLIPTVLLKCKVSKTLTSRT